METSDAVGVWGSTPTIWTTVVGSDVATVVVRRGSSVAGVDAAARCGMAAGAARAAAAAATAASKRLRNALPLTRNMVVPAAARLRDVLSRRRHGAVSRGVGASSEGTA